ncbi:hypothetical protein PQX77_014808, partial [Marasmius sp. AFHP31]
MQRNTVCPPAEVRALHSSTGQLPKDGPIIIFTASYEGEPADNASRFVDWLSNPQGDELKGVKYAVFGPGNSNWVATYQIPKLCDDVMEKRGATRLVARGEGDSAKAEFTSGLWDCLATKYQTVLSTTPTSSGFEVKTLDPGSGRTEALRQVGTGWGKVIENRNLTKPGYGEKRHIEFELSEGATYRAGDYLATALNAFLRSLASQAINRCKDLSARSIIISEKVLSLRLNILDIVVAYPRDVELTLSGFLRMLAPMRSPALSDASKRFLVVGLNYLARLLTGDRVQMSVRPSAAAFHPQDPSAPIMAYCAAGSGLAPIQGFIQMSERATQKVSGREVGKIFLFYGCRSPDADLLCADSDLAKWQKLGVVDIRPAFSRATEKSEGCRYVQDRVYHDREDVAPAEVGGPGQRLTRAK